VGFSRLTVGAHAASTVSAASWNVCLNCMAQI
jgi:hypothetical protein